MTFGIGDVSYTELYTGGSLVHDPSDAVTTSASAMGGTLVKNTTYEIAAIGDATFAGGADDAIAAGSDIAASDVAVGTTFTVGSADIDMSGGEAADAVTYIYSTNVLTQDIEAVQKKINTARVQAGSQYAALESAVNYTTDLTAQYELGYNAVNDVNFSMETAHLAKNQILQQAATAMLAQANTGQQGLLQLIQR